MSYGIFKPYTGPKWFYIVFDDDGDPIGVTRNYVSGSRCCGFKSTHTNSVESLTLSWHANCWSPRMRCIKVLHPDVVQDHCFRCDSEPHTTVTFCFTGTSPAPLRYVNDPSECGLNEHCIRLE